MSNLLKSRKRLNLILIVLAFSFNSYSQTKTFEQQIVDSIAYYENFITIKTPKTEQVHANNRIIVLLQRVLKQENSIKINFDTLKYISVLKSDDNKLHVFSWLLVRPLGVYEYYGIIMSFDESKKQYKTAILQDKTPQISAPMKKNLTPEKWYGARYYQLITNKFKGKNYYTLLGWKGIDMTQTAKVIEIITLKNNGLINFGYGIFDIKDNEYFKEGKSLKRLIFTFSSDAKMNMNYQQQIILKKIKEGKIKKQKPQYNFIAQNKEVRTDPKFKKIDGKMIVVDQLAPLNPEMEGMYAFYVPKVNVLDALYFEKGKWVYYVDIDARNDNPGAKRKQVIDYNLDEKAP